MSVAVFLADGFEETEALCPVDVMRRAGIDVVLAGVSGEYVTSSHGVTVKSDVLLDSIPGDSSFEAVFCPGGMPGSVNLSQSWKVNELIVRTAQTGVVAAICAAPGALSRAGVFSGVRITAHPSAVSEISNADVDARADVVRDGNLITSRGAGTAMAFALEIASALEGAQKALEVSSSICYTPRL